MASAHFGTTAALWVLLSLLCLADCNSGLRQSDVPEVEINSGRIRGHWEKTKSGVDYAAFTGVPYGKAPVRETLFFLGNYYPHCFEHNKYSVKTFQIGALRFQPPEVVEPWTETYEATSLSVPCAQPMTRYNGTVGAVGVEDCLQLNVYSADLEGNAPVMVRYICIHRI